MHTSRRRFLTSTAIFSTGAMLGGTTAVTGAEYERITVGAGETFEKRLNDRETWENKLIDITAQNAEAEIYALANDFTLRNIGFKGRWDTTRRGHFIIAQCTDANATGVIDNIYIGDGAASTEYPNSPNGIFVGSQHAGTLKINNLHVQHVADNAVYGSGPGNGPEHPNPGGGGDVIITNSYARDLQPAAFRVGTDGSRVENCVAVNAHRGGWAYYNNPTYVDCDFSDCQIADIYGGNGSWETDGTATVKNCRYDTSGGNIDGSSAGAPQRTKPEEVEGVPLTAEEAASGGSSGGDNGGGSRDEIDDSGNGIVDTTELLTAETFAHNELTTHYEGETGHFAIDTTGGA